MLKAKEQRSIHISFPDEEVDLYNAILREHALTYSPIASICRRHISKGMSVTPQKEMLVPA